MRNDIVNIVNKLALKSDLDFYIMETYNAIIKYCKENKTRPNSNNYDLKNGCLYINNEYIRRVEPLKRYFIDVDPEYTYYLAGKILAQTELID